MLLLLRRDRDREWSADDLVRELRASRPLVDDNLSTFEASGLVTVADDGRWRYAPAAAVLDQLCDRLEQAWRTRPATVTKAIVAAPNDKLQTFADAFRLRGDRR